MMIRKSTCVRMLLVVLSFLLLQLLLVLGCFLILRICICICMYMCMYVFICIHLYIYWRPSDGPTYFLGEKRCRRVVASDLLLVKPAFPTRVPRACLQSQCSIATSCLQAIMGYFGVSLVACHFGLLGLTGGSMQAPSLLPESLLAVLHPAANDLTTCQAQRSRTIPGEECPR